MSFTVAIDGPAGSGKGTVTKIVAEKLNLINVDPGAMFRCVALAMLEKNIKIDEEEKIAKALEEIKIDMHEDGTILLNGKDVTHRIRENDVNELVSPISVIRIIREKLLKLQREMAVGKNIIMEGRDIGHTVFPNANVKIYLTASPEVRAQRRMKQNEEKGIKTSYEEVLNNIIDRDKRDSTREIAPLRKADDAIEIDSSDLVIDEVVGKVCEVIESKM